MQEPPQEKPTRAERVLTGTAGWSYRDWEGIVYPADTPGDFDPLAYMADYVQAIEINSTFYHLPSARNVASWARRVEPWPDFRFTMKVWQGFTHGAAHREAGHRERGTTAPEPPEGPPLESQREAARLLTEAGRLGALLIQYPYGFRYSGEHLELVLRLLDALADFPRAIEMRHRSWLGDELFEALTDRGVAFVNIDQPVIGDNIPPTDIATAPLRYVRMHGRNNEEWFSAKANVESRYSYLYSEDELEPWMEKTLELAADGTTYLIFNNHGQGQALCNAIQSRRMLDTADAEARGSEKAPRKPQAPDLLVDRYPVLRQFARIRPALGERQMDLF